MIFFLLVVSYVSRLAFFFLLPEKFFFLYVYIWGQSVDKRSDKIRIENQPPLLFFIILYFFWKSFSRHTRVPIPIPIGQDLKAIHILPNHPRPRPA